MTCHRGIAGLLVCLVTLAQLGSAEAGPPAPAKAEARLEKIEPLPERPASSIINAMRKLTELQQLTVLGDRAALSQQAPLAQELKAQLLAVSEAVWANEAARQALIKHVLSGGDPTVLSILLNRKAVPAAELATARGALAYAVGDRSDSANHLQNVDLYSLPPSLGGHIALVKAVLLKDADRRAALALTDVARLLSPGTVVEETALRLAIDLSIVEGERKLFERSIRRYLMRFPASLYSEAIHVRIAGVLALTEHVGTPNGVAFLTDLGAVLAPERRRAFYAKIAEAALRGGRLAAAEQAAKLARGSAPVGDQAATNLVAIEAAALPFGTRRGEAIRLLESASTSSKSSETRELMATTRALVDMIEDPPTKATFASAGSSGTNSETDRPRAAKVRDLQARKFEALTARARKSLSVADKLLGEVER